MAPCKMWLSTPVAPPNPSNKSTTTTKTLHDIHFNGSYKGRDTVYTNQVWKCLLSLTCMLQLCPYKQYNNSGNETKQPGISNVLLIGVDKSAKNKSIWLQFHCLQLALTANQISICLSMLKNITIVSQLVFLWPAQNLDEILYVINFLRLCY